jgi:hypothetical protein
MAATFRIKNHVTLDLISKIKTNQSRELLTYLLNKYGYEAVDQGDLMKELNLHQNDGLVFKQGSSGPISRTYEFYRKNAKCGWFEADLIEINRTSKAKDAKNELEALRARVEYLENLCIQHDVEYES